MKKLAIILLFSMAHLLLNASDWKATFAEGNAFYEQGDYEQAYTTFKGLSDAYSSFELYFNTGNAAYKSNRLGEAILYYQRAKKINPTNEDLLTNLDIANAKVKDRIEELPNLGVEDAWGIATASKQLNFWSWLTIILTFLGLGLIAGSFWIKRHNLRKSLFGVGVTTLVISFGVYGMSRATFNNVLKNTSAVILSPKVEVKIGPNTEEQNAFLLHEGTTVKILQRIDGWVEIKLANGNVGWVQTSAVELV